MRTNPITYAVSLPHDEYNSYIGDSVEADIADKVLCRECNTMVREEFGCCVECCLPINEDIE